MNRIFTIGTRGPACHDFTRDVPAWLQALPDRGRILVHQLPTRAQITIDVSEQLIVELYSK